MFGQWNRTPVEMQRGSPSPNMGQQWIPSRWSGRPGTMTRAARAVCPAGTEAIRTNPLVCAPKVVTRTPGGGTVMIGKVNLAK